ncbi:hypothetical protein LSH36_44g02079 [Paralvinella palmiformis]|uniref:Uncharacterized protein n=1 Tax=Paralvinella palmiformis TaxID=53620 RepID=A0AAD9K6T5_9ANNE|nr:hypothetical protein LSH36_44g02079 [Paralvinella palmiformis]
MAALYTESNNQSQPTLNTNTDRLRKSHAENHPSGIGEESAAKNRERQHSPSRNNRHVAIMRSQRDVSTATSHTYDTNSYGNTMRPLYVQMNGFLVMSDEVHC